MPEDGDRALVHRVIYEELVWGRAEPSSRQAYREVIARLVERGVEAVILGCTEIIVCSATGYIPFAAVFALSLLLYAGAFRRGLVDVGFTSAMLMANRRRERG